MTLPLLFYKQSGVATVDIKAHTNQARVKGSNKDFCDKFINSLVLLFFRSSNTKKG